MTLNLVAGTLSAVYNMRVDHTRISGTFLDVVAWVMTSVAIVSHISEVVNPILIAVSTLLSIGWMVYRVVDQLAKNRGRDKDGDST